MKKYTFDKNIFDFIRYYAAFAVMLLHFTGYFYLTSISPEQSELKAADILRKIPVAAPPVVIFLCLSGFFAMSSLARNSSIVEYIKRRVYRLYPAIWLCTIINLLAIIAISRHSVNIKQLSIWFLTQIFGIANTPAFFKGFATGSANGALWTIFVQLQIYLIFALFYKYFSKMRAWGWSIVLSLSIFANVLCRVVVDAIGDEKLISKLIERSFVPYFIFAVIGAIVFYYFDIVIPVLTKIWPVFLVIIFLISRNILPDYGYYSGVITIVCTSLLFLGIGYLFKIRFRYDISYELFLYHWIVLNFIVNYDLINRLSFGLSMAIFFFASIILAIAAHFLLSLILKFIKI